LKATTRPRAIDGQMERRQRPDREVDELRRLARSTAGSAARR
jgi:hypothetical protein